MNANGKARYNFDSRSATRAAILLRAALVGGGGSGKTWTALLLACYLSARLKLGRVYVIDAENGAVLKYAKSKRSGKGFEFQHVLMPPDDYSPEAYCAAIEFCERAGARMIVIDSVSQEWAGSGGTLELVDLITNAPAPGREGQPTGLKSAFTSGWREMTPRHSRFVQRILTSSAHIIMTVRAKMKYELIRDSRGKMKPEQAGEGPIQQGEFIYEPDLWLHMEQRTRKTAKGEDETLTDACATVRKSRCDTIAMGEFFELPGEGLGALLAEWIEDSEPAAQANERIDPEALLVDETANGQQRTGAYAALVAAAVDMATLAIVAARYAADAKIATNQRKWLAGKALERATALQPAEKSRAAAEPVDPAIAQHLSAIGAAPTITECAQAYDQARAAIGIGEEVQVAYARRLSEAASRETTVAGLVTIESFLNRANFRSGPMKLVADALAAAGTRAT